MYELYVWCVILHKNMIFSEGSMSSKPITENTLFYGDNLIILREHIASESIDLIYLDPRLIQTEIITCCLGMNTAQRAKSK